MSKNFNLDIDSAITTLRNIQSISGGLLAKSLSDIIDKLYYLKSDIDVIVSEYTTLSEGCEGTQVTDIASKVDYPDIKVGKSIKKGVR